MSTGIQAQLGVKTESSYGTYAAPAVFQPFTSESLRLVKDYIRTVGLRAGAMMQADGLHTATTRRVEGSVSFDVLDSGLGVFLNQLHGNTVTPASLTGGLYRQRHVIGDSDPDGKSLTVQVGRPAVGGTVHPFSYLGCKVASVVFSLEQGGVVTAEVSLDGQDEDTSETLASATYSTTAKPLTFQGSSIEFDDVVLTDCVRSATVTVTIPMATERFCIGSDGLKKEPLINDQIAVEIALEAEFASMTQHNAYRNATRRKFELICDGQAESGTYGSGLRFIAPSTVTVGEGPVVEGPDVLTQALTLEVLDNGSDDPFTIEYLSSDSSI